jgi:hypothetical protein
MGKRCLLLMHEKTTVVLLVLLVLLVLHYYYCVTPVCTARVVTVSGENNNKCNSVYVH